MSPRPASGRSSVTVKLDPPMVEWLDTAAASRGVDRSECLRRLIAAHMTQRPAVVCHHRRPCRYGCDPQPVDNRSPTARVDYLDGGAP
jgi:Ribbon-helix-helix protein, copG family